MLTDDPDQAKMTQLELDDSKNFSLKRELVRCAGNRALFIGRIESVPLWSKRCAHFPLAANSLKGWFSKFGALKAAR